MMVKINRRRFAGLGLGMLGANTLPAWAQDSKRPLRIIVPLPAGGVADTSVRIFADQWTNLTKQTVVVDNRPGGSFVIAMQQLTTSAPDGYTWIHLNNGMSAAQASFGRYDLTTQMTPIGMMGSTPGALFVNAESPMQSSKDVMDWVKANPGKLNYGAVLGGSEHLLTAGMLKRYGFTGTLIPFKGGPDAMTALAQKEIDFAISALPLIIPFKGRIKPVCVTTLQRSSMMPDVATFQEQGWDIPELNYWGALGVPAGTPAAVIDAHQKTMAEVLAVPSLGQKYAAQGMVPKVSNSEVMARIIAEEVKWMTPVATTLNLKAG